MHHNGMSFGVVLPLTLVALIALSGKGVQSFEITTIEIIEKGVPRNVKMDCTMESTRQKCTWHLGPLSMNLTKEDPPDLVERHTITINRRIKSCELKISDLKFEDGGVYECRVEDGPPEFIWTIKINANPGKPTISYENRTEISDELVVIDETPVTLPLRCLSSNAKPEQENLRWEINGEAPAKEPAIMVMGPANGPWNATSNLWLTFSEEDGVQRAVKRVTCIVDHVTGQRKTRKVFGVRNDDRTVKLVHNKTENSEHGQLQCSANLFPWPNDFRIVKMGKTNYTHFGPEVKVKEDGRYVCKATVAVQRADGRKQYNWLGESNVVVIGDDPTSGSVATSTGALYLVVIATMSALILVLGTLHV